MPVEAPVDAAPQTGTIEAEPEAYLLGVGDDVQVSVLSAPELSGLAKVRPDGAITIRGAGMIHALGRTPEDVGREAEEKLGGILRHARVDLSVLSFGEQRVFVMGEVEQPGDKPYYKGMSALQAVAAAGGLSNTGQSKSVLVLRRTGSDAAEVRRLDLGLSLKGESGPDVVLHPYDIVFVPRTFIARANIAVDQYVRQMIAPLTLYLEGWRALAIATGKVKLVATL
jgi:protein involved in polysaccharide export with SLBB domain